MSNLYDLLEKLQKIEEAGDQNAMRRPMAQQSAERMAAQKQQPQPQPQDQGGAGAADECMSNPVEECPTDGNVQLSMQDLVKLVKALQGGGEPQGMPGDQPLMGDDEFDEEYGNTPNPQVGSVDCVTPTGDDMFSKGDEAEKVNGGGNPLQAHLAELYAQIKERETQIAELSKGTLASYAKKASAGASNAAFKAGMTRDDKEFSKQNKKASKREAGLDKAIDKLSLKEANELARKLRKI